MHSLKHDRWQRQDAGVAPVPLASLWAVLEYSLTNHAVSPMPIWAKFNHSAVSKQEVHQVDMILAYCKSELVQMQHRDPHLKHPIGP